jgi:hypothetical protein
MKNDFEEIRAERERPARYRQNPEKFDGLWKQIAMGIVVAYCAITILTAIGWLIVINLMMGNLNFVLPW